MLVTNLLTWRIWSILEKILDRKCLCFATSPYIYLFLVSSSISTKFVFCRCPYYITREVHKDVDILFAPYNYFISNAYSKYLKVDWNNSVLIFDEAHNLVSPI